MKKLLLTLALVLGLTTSLATVASAQQVHLDATAGAQQERAPGTVIGIYDAGLTLSYDFNSMFTIYAKGNENFVNRGTNPFTGASNFTVPTGAFGATLHVGKSLELGAFTGTTYNEFINPNLILPGQVQTYHNTGVYTQFRLF